MRPGVLRELKAELPGVGVGPIVAAAAAVVAASAWFNEGFFSHDEHFQILEFAWFKLGRTPPAALAWEFGERMRPAIQPWLAAGVFKVLGVPRVVTPFFAEFLLRLASGLLGLWVSLEVCLRTIPWVREPSLKRLLLVGMLFLWFLPYEHGRFASENWGGILFFGGVCLLLDARAAATRARAIHRSACAGLLWGAAFFCRFQVGLAVAGAGLWLVLVDRVALRILIALAVSFALACAVNVTIDHWLYGAWVCTPCNYFYTNIVLGKAAAFSTEPWWFYLGQMLGLLVPPFSLLLVALLGVSVWCRRSNVLVWSVVPFVVGHTLLGHKEVRFLIPMTYALVPLLALGGDCLPEAMTALKVRPMYAIAVRLFVVLNVLALMVMTFKPSSETAVVYRRLYEESRRGPMVLYSASALPYSMAGSAVDFYRPENLTLKALDVPKLRAETNANPHRVFLFQQSLDPPDWIAANHLACAPLARTIPLWASQVNVNNWTSRMYQWSVFAIATGPSGPC